MAGMEWEWPIANHSKKLVRATLRWLHSKSEGGKLLVGRRAEKRSRHMTSVIISMDLICRLKDTGILSSFVSSEKRVACDVCVRMTT